MFPSPRSIITIDLAAARDNVRFLLRKLSPGVRLLVAVKADAYGHGAQACARTAIEARASGVAVATAEEAVALRDAGFDKLILVMGPLYSPDQYLEMVNRGVEFAVVSKEMADMLGALRGVRPKARIHLKIDSGMNRQGLLPHQMPEFLRRIGENDGVELVGVMTHFADAPDSPESVHLQLERFLPCVRAARREWPHVTAHAANSAATMYHPHTHLDMVRCGVAVYGLSPQGTVAETEGLRPVLSWTSRVALVKPVAAGEGVGYGLTFRPAADTHIALVPVGYADGVFRLLGNRGEVLIAGTRYRMVGRVSMDSFGVDVGHTDRVQAGDVVTIIGRDGDARISAEDLARWAETINYEITCNTTTARGVRIFTGDN